MPRAVAALGTIAALAGCQCLGLHTPETSAGTEAAPACPAVTKAEAWVNRMPTIGDEPTKMIVMLGVESKDSWFLTPLDMPAAQGLVLDLKPGGAAVPGTVGYRQMAPAPLPAGIRILCRGSEVATIDNVMIVQ
ncbi:hypothetical protein [uncultured Hyphomonas sp.]|uniref:hypothetical protein n=1 Tax=uncultured Hyphomonas sp. TaxID=225298 RepID=UPI002AABB007|nr:hypothetical protein [uncultured Hyphomonas sp.]